MHILPVLWLKMTEHGYLANPAMENKVRSYRKYFTDPNLTLTLTLTPTLTLTLAMTLTLTLILTTIGLRAPGVGCIAPSTPGVGCIPGPWCRVYRLELEISCGHDHYQFSVVPG